MSWIVVEPGAAPGRAGVRLPFRMADLGRATTELLQALVRFNTVNPPGNERPAIEHLERYTAAAGFETEILGETHDRANLVATLTGEHDGPTLLYLGHVDTVLA